MVEASSFVILLPAMVVVELLKWRTPLIVVLLWVLLCFNGKVSQDEDRSSTRVCNCLKGVVTACRGLSGFPKDVECIELFAGAQEVTGALRRDCCLIYICMLPCV